MIYTTPGLERFEVSWHVDPDNVPRPVSEDFLAEKFMEDVLDAAGGTAPSFTITEVRVPSADDMVDTLVEITFHIVATVPDAATMKAYDFEIHPMRNNIEGWDYTTEPEGMTWGDFTSILRGTLPVSDQEAWKKEVRATDDNDPNARWFRVMGIKHDDDGIFLAIEEIQP